MPIWKPRPDNLSSACQSFDFRTNGLLVLTASFHISDIASPDAPWGDAVGNMLHVLSTFDRRDDVRTLDEKEAGGLRFAEEVMGAAFAGTMRSAAQSENFGSDIGRMALSFAFNDAWQQPGLDRKSKSIAVISALIASHQPKELKNHVKIGIANGLSVAEFEGLLVQLTPYVGFPSVASATTVVIEALREAGCDLAVRTSEEKGLL